MVSDWLKTKKKPARTNQIRAVSTTKFKRTAMVFSKRRFDLCTQNNNRKIKKIPKTQTVKRTSFRLNKKLNKLLITDYAKVENKEQNGGNHTQAMTAPLLRHLNENGYEFSMITTRTSSHVILLLEEILKIWFKLNQCAKIPELTF